VPRGSDLGEQPERLAQRNDLSMHRLRMLGSQLPSDLLDANERAHRQEESVRFAQLAHGG